MPDTMQRRAFLRLGLAGVGGATVGVLSACRSDTPRDARPNPTRSPQPAQGERAGRVLLAYFSRPGENYWNGGRRNLKVGNTEVLARAISARLDCDVHRIEPVDPYPADYDATVERNVREQDTDARPAIASPLPSIDEYDTMLLASPIWNVRAPMIMATFTESLDFAGKTVHPVTTYAMSGLGTTERDYAASCPGATIAEGLAVQGEEVAAAEPTVRAWLQRTGLRAR
jgi:flavodoxin